MNIPSKQYGINRSPNENEWYSINEYKRRALDFIEKRAKVAPKTISISAKRPDCGGFSGDSNIPDIEKLKLFYLSFRFFYQQREASCFLKVRNIISNIAQGDHEKLYLKSLKYMWNCAMTTIRISETLNKKISGRELLDLWFNSKLFHSELEKRKQLTIVNNLLSENLSSSFLFLTVFKAGAPVGLFYKVIEHFSIGNPMITVPNDFIKYNQ